MPSIQLLIGRLSPVCDKLVIHFDGGRGSRLEPPEVFAEMFGLEAGCTSWMSPTHGTLGGTWAPEWPQQVFGRIKMYRVTKGQQSGHGCYKKSSPMTSCRPGWICFRSQDEELRQEINGWKVSQKRSVRIHTGRDVNEGIMGRRVGSSGQRMMFSSFQSAHLVWLLSHLIWRSQTTEIISKSKMLNIYTWAIIE